MPTRGPEPGGAAANPTPGGAAANPPPGDSTGPATDGRLIAALVVGQLGLHGVMAGLRMAVPLAALREGASAWTVGLLLSLFALAPVLLALHSGRLADRHGYHRPVRLAALVTAAGAALALASTWTEGAAKWALLAGAAMATGTGANLGMLTIQRTAGLAAADSAERMKVFSWLAVAPSFANVIGPVAVGVAIDLAGFRAAYALLVVVPALTLATTRLVPRLPPPPAPQPGAEAGGAGAWDLLALPQMKRLLGVNGLISMCWDVHAFAVPILGHARGFSATTIGLVLGTFTASVTLVRLVVPMLAARVAKADGEVAVVRAAMLGTAAVFALYPLAPNAGAMAACAALLGITLGVVQPMMLATLHRLTPAHRHGQALAFRSMAINASSTAMPLVFGAAGATVGAPLLFWLVGGAVGAGSWATRRLEAAQPPAAGAAGEAGASEGSAAGRSTTGTGAGGAQPRGRRDSRG